MHFLKTKLTGSRIFLRNLYLLVQFYRNYSELYKRTVGIFQGTSKLIAIFVAFMFNAIQVYFINILFISNKIIFVISVVIGTVAMVLSLIIIISLIIYYLNKRWKQTSRRLSITYGETIPNEEKLEN
jgi:membrane protein YdbS with pleckstrin-like domain